MNRRIALLMGLAAGVAGTLRQLAAAKLPAARDDDPAVGSCNVRPGHMRAAPVGVGSEFAASVVGGSGEGQHFVDVEQGWTLEHDSLLAHRIREPLTGTIHDGSRAHGTAVLGIVCGASATGGYVGLAPRVASVHVASRVESAHDAISRAVEKLVELNHNDAGSGGGVLLLETQAQMPSPQGNMCNLPIESHPELFALIRRATQLGITVIEAAGNGCDAIVPETGIDLDEYADESGVRILRRNSARGDSGAIVVGAARAEVQDGRHRRVASSNYGSRIDCYAWGEAVTAPSSTAHAPYATTACTADFGETSAAAAIIAGVALIVQGVVSQAEPGRRVAPRRLREILGDPALGTGCVIAQGRIGVMPDLARILTPGVLGVTLRRAPHFQAVARE